MAESSHLRKNEPIDFGGDDPFAELTRIMGFDPREPVKRAQLQPANTSSAPSDGGAGSVAEGQVSPSSELAPEAVAAIPSDETETPATAQVGAVEAFDGFDIDLERELVGDFEDEFTAALSDAETDSSERSHVQSQPDAVSVTADPVQIVPEFQVAQAAATDGPAGSGHQVSVAVSPEASLAVEQVPELPDELFSEADFDVAFKATLDDGLPSDFNAEDVSAKLSGQLKEAVAPEAPAIAVAADYGTDGPPSPLLSTQDVELPPASAAARQTVTAVDTAMAEPAERASVQNDEYGVVEAAFDDAFSTELQSERGDHPMHAEVLPIAAEAVRQIPLEVGPTEVAEASGVSAQPAYDSDIDFDLDAELEREMSRPLEPLAIIEVANTAEDAQQLSRATQPPAEAVLPFMEAAEMRAASDREYASVRADSHVPEDVVPVNDLLADVDMDFGAQFDQEEVVLPAPALAAVAVETTPEPVAEQLAPIVAAQPVRREMPDLEAELNALLGNLGARPATAEGSRWASRANHVALNDTAEGVASSGFLESEPAMQAKKATTESWEASSTVDDELDELLHVMTAEVNNQASAPEPVMPARSAQRVHQDYRAEPNHQVGWTAAGTNGKTSYIPEIETVDVPEPAQAYLDDLDIPDLDFDEPTQAKGQLDPYHTDYSDADYGQPAVAASPVKTAPVHDFDAEFDALYRQVREAAGALPPTQPAAYAAEPQDFDDAKTSYGYHQDYAIEAEDEREAIAAPYQAVKPSPRRTWMIAAAVGGVALLGAAGAFALSFGGGESGSDVPVVVKADADPVKVRPENPGGTSIPNQDSKVFETMAEPSARTQAPLQERLVSTSEEPVDLASEGVDEGEDIVAEAKGDDRLDPSVADGDTANQEIVAVTPRKVKTMVVKPDGTLVPREEVSVAAPALKPVAAPMPAAPAAAAPAAEAPRAPALETASVASAEPASAPASASTVPVPMAAAPTEPASSPAEQVAAVAPTAAAAGSWSVQIASQPSAEGAQATYDDLAKRYGSVLGGRGVNIVKADIAGKGTYWRVRVPAASKNDAISLCESYKSAGGNCFVSR